jgi:tetratricopeptide (TPR) repeat protein
VIAALLAVAALSGAPPDTAVTAALREAFARGPAAGQAELDRLQAARPHAVTVPILLATARQLRSRDDTDAAIAALQAAASLFPQAAVPYRALGSALMAAQRLDEARAAYLRSLELDIYSPTSGKRLDWIDGSLAARRQPAAVPSEVLERCAGTFGPYRVTASAAGLTVRGPDEAAWSLLPVAETLFEAMEVPGIRFWCAGASGGPAQRLLVLRFDGGVETWARTVP